MAQFDKEYLERIISIENIKGNTYKIEFDSGETEEVELSKSRAILVLKSFKQIQESKQSKSDGLDPAKSNGSDSETTPSTTNNKPKKKGTATWRPASLLELEGKNPNKTYYLADTHNEVAMNKHIAEGWEICRDPNVKFPGRTLRDGSSMGSAPKLRELTVLEMPIEGKREREEYYASLQRSAIERKEEIKSSLGDTSYGEISAT